MKCITAQNHKYKVTRHYWILFLYTMLNINFNDLFHQVSIIASLAHNVTSCMFRQILSTLYFFKYDLSYICWCFRLASYSYFALWPLNTFLWSTVHNSVSELQASSPNIHHIHILSVKSTQDIQHLSERRVHLIWLFSILI